jgi:hypothetical protein
MVAPKDYIPSILVEPELTEDEWREYQESLVGVDTSTF